jgi:Mg2+/Co2+ transporter CorB
MDYSLFDTFGSPALIGSIFTFLANKAYEKFRDRQKKPYLQSLVDLKELEIRESNINKQVTILLDSHVEYKNYMNEEMNKLLLRISEMRDKHENEIRLLQEKYEEKMDDMQKQVTKLSDEVIKYRRENGALHLLLTEKGISVPSWIKTNI